MEATCDAAGAMKTLESSLAQLAVEVGHTLFSIPEVTTMRRPPKAAVPNAA